ncbi:WSC domain-containing protein [Podospora didyma]|uniref:WSC domain-containing protein n=1 Tax=Podospora didyma TaxID=330526 RepID=A0AAE0N8R9_9PEZI|nr:WSC domain-containing protein [Podospora didyma]
MAPFKPMAAALAVAALVSRVQATTVELPPCLDPFQPFVYSGCFQDTGSPHALTFRSNLDSQSMTIETCVAECKGNGYRYAGLEYYGVCFCGQTVSGTQLSEDKCNYPCTGNNTQTCGGSDIISVYQDPTYSPISEVTLEDYAPLGCWTDNSNLGKALTYRQDQVASGTLTTEGCLQACKDGGFPFAGTEYGGECYCGVVIGNDTYSAPSTDCSMPCNGNSAQTCGGPARLNLYVADELQSLQPCGYVPPVVSSSAPPVESSTPPPVESSTAPPVESSTPPPIKSSTTTTPLVVSSSTTPPASSSPTTPPASSSTPSSTSSTSSTPSSTSKSSSSSTSCTTTPKTSSTSSKPTSTSSKPSSTSCTTTPKTSSTASTKSSSTTKPPTTTPPTTTSKTTSSVCYSTTTAAPTCEYKCGKWCSSPLPDWDDVPGCKDGHSNCKLQVAACFKYAGFPDNLECFDYGSWCAGVSNYCGGVPKGGKCSKKEYIVKKQPKGYKPPTTTVITVPCKATSTAKTTTTSSSTTKVQPSPTNICKQPTNKQYGYGPDSPVADIDLPIVTCNDLSKDFSKYPFKLYNENQSSQCKSYPRNSCTNACADACKEQYDDCNDVYVQSCKGKRSTPNYFHWARDTVVKRTSGWTDSYNTAVNKCKQQYNDCLYVNRDSTGAGKCSSYGQGY